MRIRKSSKKCRAARVIALAAVDRLESRTLLSRTVYVDDTAPAGSLQNGASWDNAYTSLQTALASAQVGDVVRVAQGDYTPTPTMYDVNASFQLKNGVQLLGGFAGWGSANPNARDVASNVTTLSGVIGMNAGGEPIKVYHVVRSPGMDATAVLDGFTITFGDPGLDNANPRGGGVLVAGGAPTIANCVFIYNLFGTNLPNAGGGAIANVNASPTITNCTFESNGVVSMGTSFKAMGGAMQNIGSSSPNVTNCVFQNSGADSYYSAFGGAVYNDAGSAAVYTNCTFTHSGASGQSNPVQGGAMYNVAGSNIRIVGCTFKDNWAYTTFGASDGGAIFNTGATIQISNSSFDNNNASGPASADGGAIAYMNNASGAITNCTFTNNRIEVRAGSANASGGAISVISSAPSITDSLFRGNLASGTSTFNYSSGGALAMVNSSGGPTVTRCTFLANRSTAKADARGGAIHVMGGWPSIINCLIVGNSAVAQGTASQSNAYGGGIEFESTSTGVMINTTIVANTATGGAGGRGGGIYGSNGAGSIKNSIVWDNLAAVIPGYFAASTPTYSDLQTANSGTGNIRLDPKFVRNPSAGPDGVWLTADDDFGDLRLRADSPCIDVASNAAMVAGMNVDLSGAARMVDIPGVNGSTPIVDMGAYERQSPTTLVSSNMTFAFETQHYVQVEFNALPNGIEASDLQLTNLTTGQSFTPANAEVGYFGDPQVLAARFTFAPGFVLPDGNYRATLPATAATDAWGYPILADATLNFFVLNGDANHDRHVDDADRAIVTSHMNSPGTFAAGDFNYDGIVNAADLAILDGNWRIWLPAQGAFALPATAGADAHAVGVVSGYLHVWLSGASQLSYRVPLGAMTSINFDGLGGQDTITVRGTAAADTVKITAANTTLGGATIGFTNVERIVYDTGGSTAADTLTLTGAAHVSVEGFTRLASLGLSSDAQLDIGENDLIITGMLLADVRTYVRTAYNFGGWDGASGIFSSSAKNNPTGNTTLGMLTGTQYFNNNGDTQFNGAPVRFSDVLVKYTYFGDIDFNGSIDASDYNLIDYGFANHLTGWSNGDADYSGGPTDVSDYNLIDFAFATQGGAL